jgi:RNA polymerase sigma factor (TIGR02999 family)
MPSDATQLLADIRAGRRAAAEELFPLVYQELRGLAAHLVRGEPPNQRPDSTSLVHEAYLRLVNQKNADWQDRAHFCAVAAQAMRRILVDHARRRKREKRGGGRDQVPLDSALTMVEDAARADLEALDEALDRLAAINARAAQAVELRFFAGLTSDETAAALGLSVSTVEREWRYARSWLYCALATGAAVRKGSGDEGSGTRTAGR